MANALSGANQRLYISPFRTVRSVCCAATQIFSAGDVMAPPNSLQKAGFIHLISKKLGLFAWSAFLWRPPHGMNIPSAADPSPPARCNCKNRTQSYSKSTTYV
jgi:hypothetical protein